MPPFFSNKETPKPTGQASFHLPAQKISIRSRRPILPWFDSLALPRLLGHGSNTRSACYLCNCLLNQYFDRRCSAVHSITWSWRWAHKRVNKRDGSGFCACPRWNAAPAQTGALFHAKGQARKLSCNSRIQLAACSGCLNFPGLFWFLTPALLFSSCSPW